MRGFPLLNLILVGAGLLILLIPLLRLDAPMRSRAVADEVASEEAVKVPVALVLRFVHSPQEVSLKIGGQEMVLRGEGLERQGEGLVALADRALELKLKAAWPAGVDSTMVELRAGPDGMSEQTQNVWAEKGAADEILRFAWRAKP